MASLRADSSDVDTGVASFATAFLDHYNKLARARLRGPTAANPHLPVPVMHRTLADAATLADKVWDRS